MNFDETKHYLKSKPDAFEDYPFGPATIVMKIKGKMFATLSRKDGIFTMNLKCAPHEAVQLRDVYESVKPGYHMNKKHWNTIILDGSIPPGEIERMIDQSYGLVVKSLKVSERKQLELTHSLEELYK